MRDSVGAQASSVTISMEGRGNDVFLYWVADCEEHEGEGGQYTFMEGIIDITTRYSADTYCSCLPCLTVRDEHCFLLLNASLNMILLVFINSEVVVL